ncbi:Exosome complex component Csl4 [Candidatus Gugararchaeum adminiculabundum]|nr:Exosome complex component Csl4 [Candidatus Gugararchaeum adminiculabundum]
MTRCYRLLSDAPDIHINLISPNIANNQAYFVIFMEERIVLPGELLGTEEEYLVGSGTFADKHGVIYATLQGMLHIAADKTLSVTPKKTTPQLLTVGMTVVGMVELISDPIALVRIGPMHEGHLRHVSNMNYCVLHVSQIKKGYLKQIREVLRIGDVIKAKVSKVTPEETYLSTADPGFGVLKKRGS